MRFLHLPNNKTIDFELVAELAEKGYSLVRAATKIEISDVTLSKHLKLNDYAHLHAQLKKNGLANKTKMMKRVNQSQLGGRK